MREAGIEIEGSPDPIVLYAPGVKWTIREENSHEVAETVVELNSSPLVLELRKRAPGATEITVGRGPDNDIILEEATVSRTHALFRKEPHTGMWHVVDAERHNGTFLAGVIIVPGRPMPLFERMDVIYETCQLSGLKVYPL